MPTRLLPLLALLFLAGCSSYGVSGKFVEGPSSVLVMADPKDARFSKEGIAGVEVVVWTKAEPRRLVGKGTSDAAGRFSVSIAKEFNMDQLEIRASHPGFVPAATPIFASQGERRLLGVLKPAPGR